MVGRAAGRSRVGRRWVAFARYQCACGDVKVLPRGTKLKDCGCGIYEAPRHEAHGGYRMGLYEVWRSMRRRCADPENPRYGGRGISVCDRWRDSFAAFLEDVGPRPFDGASLDRIDNAKGYEPGNVRWATATQQGRNKDNNRVVEAFGERLCLAAWGERSGIAPSAIAARLEAGWSPENAVTVPTNGAT